MDVKSAFLNGIVKEEVYVEQPPGFEDPKMPTHVYKLNKALYELKQAPRAWYARLSSFLISKDFTRGKVDITLFTLKRESDILIVQIYVDDIVFGSTNLSLCQEFEELMKHEFEMSLMGELSYFLGLQIKQLDDGIFINQARYVTNLLSKYGFENCKHLSTPMSVNVKLDLDSKGQNVDQKLYRGMIGSLLYLTASRPDIQYSVGVCARFQSCPKESHLIVVKRIFRYLSETEKLGLWYPKGQDFSLHAYSDADYAGCMLDRKSTSGTCQFLAGCLISWSSRKQGTVALSTAEAEYVAAGSCCSQVLWIKHQLCDYESDLDCIPLLCDNTSAINLSKNPVHHARTKHIEVRHHFIRDHVESRDIDLRFISTEK